MVEGEWFHDVLCTRLHSLLTLRVSTGQEMTTDICQSPPGELTDDMLQRAPDLMHAWSHTKVGGTESALAVESLLVRLLEERAVKVPRESRMHSIIKCQ